jgi:hypothetical protein
MILRNNAMISLKEKPMLEMLIASYSRGLGQIWRKIPNTEFSLKNHSILIKSVIL